MGIPIIGEIWDGLRWIIDLFLDKAPRQVQILIFLLFILLFGSIISVFLHISGYHCNTDKEVVKVDFLDLPTNLLILRLSFQEVIDAESYTVEEIHDYNSVLDINCYYLLEETSPGDYEFCANETDPNCLYYYRDPDCFNCSTVNAGWALRNTVIPTYIGEICSGDTFPIIWTSYQRYFACEALCEIPEHYRFESDNASYACEDTDYCGVNKTIEPNTRVNQILKNSGAEAIYLDDNEKSYKNMLVLKCNNNYNPRLTIFGIDLFDYKIWLLLIVLYIMITFFLYIKSNY